MLCRVPQNELTGEVCSRWEWYPPLPVCSNFMQTLKFFLCVQFVGRQTMWACVFCTLAAHESSGAESNQIQSISLCA